jgi:hypothetical protein
MPFPRFRQALGDQLARFEGHPPLTGNIGQGNPSSFGRDQSLIRGFFGSKPLLAGYIPTIQPTVDVFRFLGTRNERTTLTNTSSALTLPPPSSQVAQSTVPEGQVWLLDFFGITVSGTPTGGAVRATGAIRIALPAGANIPIQVLSFDRALATAFDVVERDGVVFTEPVVMNPGDALEARIAGNAAFTGSLSVQILAVYRQIGLNP